MAQLAKIGFWTFYALMGVGALLDWWPWNIAAFVTASAGLVRWKTDPPAQNAPGPSSER
jgi:hypothetical protein